MNGLGKGLGALLSDDGISSSNRTSARKEIKEKEKELKDLLEEIDSRKKEVDELRKELTIQLMLEGKVDKTRLFDLEEKLKYCLDMKEKYEIEIEDLRSEMRTQVQLPSFEGHKEASEHDVKGPGIEIDMRMVKDLMFEGSEGYVKEGKGTIEDDEREHMDELREELDRSKEAKRVRDEAYPGMEKQAPVQKRRIMRDPMEDTTVAHPFIDAIQPNEPKGQVQKKVRVVRRLKSNGKRSKDARMYKIIEEAQFHLSNEDPAAAKLVLHQALREYPLDDELLYHLGNAFFMEGDLESAEIRFRKAVEANPMSFRAFNNLGVVLKKKGERESAIQAFNQALEINESYERSWLNLGTIFMEIQPAMLKEARIFLRRALECDPNLIAAKEKLQECEILLSNST